MQPLHLYQRARGRLVRRLRRAARRGRARARGCRRSGRLAVGSSADAGAGVGGTRFCDWWLTERAVLIDTAGRYTTQDSDAEADKAGWERFLDLLKKNRPQQPLNGVLVVVLGVGLLVHNGFKDNWGRARPAQLRPRSLA